MALNPLTGLKRRAFLTKTRAASRHVVTCLSLSFSAVTTVGLTESPAWVPRAGPRPVRSHSSPRPSGVDRPFC